MAARQSLATPSRARITSRTFFSMRKRISVTGRLRLRVSDRTTMFENAFASSTAGPTIMACRCLKVSRQALHVSARAREAIDAHDDEGVSGGDRFDEAGEHGAGPVPARGLLLVDGGASGRLQRLFLRQGGLLVCGDACVSDEGHGAVRGSGGVAGVFSSFAPCQQMTV